MIILTIGNSTSQITGLNPAQHNELKELLSYRITSNEINYGKGRYGAHKRTLLGRRGDFPSGLLYIVQDWLKNKPHGIQETRVKPLNVSNMFNLRLK